MKIKYYLATAIYIIAPISYAAGFDCSKARTLVEETICSDSELSSLDDDLNEQYGNVLGHNNMTNNTATANRIKKEQKSWLLNIRNKCKTSTCLKKVYRKRVNALSNSY